MLEQGVPIRQRVTGREVARGADSDAVCGFLREFQVKPRRGRRRVPWGETLLTGSPGKH